ncbi:hypothetical protein PC123_g23604 [Phytophthora cactorum]|nr:hypothetical protein PC123_g23604 [Phytophthora cactorum]
MPGLSTSELTLEALHAGETVEYYVRAFVSGDPKGHRVAVVTSVDNYQDLEYSVSVDTGDPIPLDTMTKQLDDRFGKPFTPEAAKWRKLRMYPLHTGSFSAPSRASSLKKALEGAVEASVQAVYKALRDMREESVPERAQSDSCSSHEPEVELEPVSLSSTSICDLTSEPSPGKHSTTTKEPNTSNEFRGRTSISQIINLVSSEDENAMASGAASSDAALVCDDKVQEVSAYVQSIPSRYARSKIRHQTKKRSGQWHLPRWRKRRDEAKCAITRGGNQIYHAKTVKAMQIQSILRSPDVKRRLQNLHARRSTFSGPDPKEARTLLKEVPWPEEIEKITPCKTNGVKFTDIGKFDACKCIGDCFLDVYKNVYSETFCTPSY